MKPTELEHRVQMISAGFFYAALQGHEDAASGVGFWVRVSSSGFAYSGLMSLCFLCMRFRVGDHYHKPDALNSQRRHAPLQV